MKKIFTSVKLVKYIKIGYTWKKVKGETRELECWYLTDKSHCQPKQSSYSNNKGGTDNKNGLHARLTFTINGVGMMAAPFITVTAITEKELPRSTCPSGIYILVYPDCVQVEYIRTE